MPIVEIVAIIVIAVIVLAFAVVLFAAASQRRELRRLGVGASPPPASGVKH